jgi:hypothetical protein
MFSAISEADRKTIIQRCFWPLLKLCDRGVPFAIQMSTVSLEILRELDPAAVDQLKMYLQTETCELIGNGHAQIIAPLVPDRVNFFNQKIGQELYQKYLDVSPQVATINEMVYSGGILQHFAQNGYDSVLMEWNNPYHAHPEWRNEWRYHRQKIKGNDTVLDLIWVDSIIFQKFQRYVHGELPFEDYLKYIDIQNEKADGGNCCLYASDAEIFDFRPQRYHDEARIYPEGEWTRIYKLFDFLREHDQYQVILPSKILKSPATQYSDQTLILESPVQPIPVKKQEKYTLNRWALTGKGDLNINTTCYKIYDRLNNHEGSKEDLSSWKELCFLWSSDFRTHINLDRWSKYQQRLKKLHDQTQERQGGEKPVQIGSPPRSSVPMENRNYQFEEDDHFILINSDAIQCKLKKTRGLAIQYCQFNKKWLEPLFGTIEHGFYDDISLAADFYSAHTVIERPAAHKISDLGPVQPEIICLGANGLEINGKYKAQGVKFEKRIFIDFRKPSIHLMQEIKMESRFPGIVRPLHVTFFPQAFDSANLFFATHNGGENLEYFHINDQPINHAENLSQLISAKRGLGMTKGVVLIGDDKKHLRFEHDQTVAALIPSLNYRLLPNGQYFFRLQYSAQEMDETFVPSPEKVVIKSSLVIS